MSNLIVQNSRLIFKLSDVPGATATIAPSLDHTDGTWSETDIYIGELFVNEIDNIIQTRTSIGIIDLYPGGTASSGVQSYANFASFPLTGYIDTIYIDESTELMYRWDGGVYVQLSTTASVAWSSITAGPTSSPSQIDNAVLLAHGVSAPNESHYTKVESDAAAGASGAKQDKEVGKGLSTNDFDNTYKGFIDNFDPNVEDYALFSAFPVGGTANKLYIDDSTDQVYRWDNMGATYVLLVPGGTGAMGPQGPAGSGSTGPTGPPGATSGIVGPQGAMGIGVTGAMGPQGLQGIHGESGFEGVLVYDGVVSVNLNNTSENVLETYTLLADTLGATSDAITVSIVGTVAATATVKTIRFKIDGNTIIDNTSFNASPNDQTWKIEGKVIRTAFNQARAMITFSFSSPISGTTIEETVDYTLSADFTTNLDIELTGQLAIAAANELQCSSFYVDKISQGNQGFQGNTGPAGAQGPQGVMGTTGSAGPQGVAGPTGSVGPTGSIGPQGVVGSTGPQGTAGPTGAVGAQGPQGLKGVTGAGYYTLSNTSFSMASTAGSFAVSGGLGYSAGETVLIRYDATNYMVATVTLYIDGGPGLYTSSLDVTILYVVGSGTYSAWTINLTGLLANSPVTLFTQSADKTVGATVSELSIIGTGIGTTSVASNFLTIGKTLEFHIRGYHSSTANPDITLKLKLGGTTLATATVTSGNGTNDGFIILGSITCRTTGATGTVVANAQYLELHSSGAMTGILNTSAVTINTTIANIFDVTAQWSVNNAGNTITSQTFILEAFN